MATAFFSIIIPTLNEERFLPRLLEALARQRFKQFETIVVDASSKDQTVIRALPYRRKLFSLKILSTRKRNVSFQRNLGAENAKGEYLVFFDADVVISDNYFLELYQIVTRDDVPVLTTWLLPDTNRPQDEMIIYLTNLGLELAKKIDRPLAPGFNLISKRDVFYELGGFDERVRLAEDHDIVQRALSCGYPLKIYRQPRLVASLRRLRREGMLKLMTKYAYATLYIFIKGPITEEIVAYPMGGHLYDNQQLPQTFTYQRFLSLSRFSLYRSLSLSPKELKVKMKRSGQRLIESVTSPAMVEKFLSRIRQL